jgi:hypothetical protein
VGDAPDQVYAFTIDATVLFEATVEGYDTVLSLHSGCDATGIEHTCNDDDDAVSHLGSRIALELEPGTYYLVVDGYDGDSGIFSMSVRFKAVTCGNGACDAAETTSDCPEDCTSRVTHPHDTDVHVPPVDDAVCADRDGDGICNAEDDCPFDRRKQYPGQCGCGIAEIDQDADGVFDCIDLCPNDSRKSDPGVCGCRRIDLDSDADGVYDCHDACPHDPDKITPGECGCGIADNDDCDAIPDVNRSRSGCSVVATEKAAFPLHLLMILSTACAMRRRRRSA